MVNAPRCQAAALQKACEPVPRRHLSFGILRISLIGCMQHHLQRGAASPSAQSADGSAPGSHENRFRRCHRLHRVGRKRHPARPHDRLRGTRRRWYCARCSRQWDSATRHPWWRLAHNHDRDCLTATRAASPAQHPRDLSSIDARQEGATSTDGRVSRRLGNCIARPVSGANPCAVRPAPELHRCVHGCASRPPGVWPLSGPRRRKCRHQGLASKHRVTLNSVSTPYRLGELRRWRRQHQQIHPQCTGQRPLAVRDLFGVADGNPLTTHSRPGQDVRHPLGGERFSPIGICQPCAASAAAWCWKCSPM